MTIKYYKQKYDTAIKILTKNFSLVNKMESKNRQTYMARFKVHICWKTS